MLGVPLGFSLLGLFRAERTGIMGTIGLACILWPLCILLALSVEFIQVFIPERTSSGSDVLAQGLGAIVGMLGWWESGPQLTRLLRAWQTSPDINNLATRLFIGYLLLLGLLQFLPLDLTLSPGRMARKAYYDVHFVPFSEFVGLSAEQGWRQIQNWLGLGITFVPLGLLGTRMRRQRENRKYHHWDMIALFLVVPFALESGQIFVQSRLPTAAGFLIAVLGTVIGGVLAQMCLWSSTRLISILGLILWFSVMAVMMWAPFHFESSISYSCDTLLPLGEIRFSDPIAMFCQWVTRLIAYSLLGSIIAINCEHSGKCVWMGFIIGMCVGLSFELIQLFLPARTPGATDVLLAATGTAIGARITSRLQTDKLEHAV